MRPPRAVVFDLDGTLADTKLDIAAACNHALVALGRAPRAVDDVAGLVGDGARVLVARAFDVPVGDPDAEEGLRVFSAYYSLHAADRSIWMPGAREALGACERLGIKVAVATNKPRPATVLLLSALGLSGRFGAVVAGGDGPLKPEPAVIHAAVAPLGVAAVDAWVVGDGAQDVLAGKAAGAGTVAVLGGFGQEAVLRAASPDVVLASMRELLPLLEASV